MVAILVRADGHTDTIKSVESIRQVGLEAYEVKCFGNIAIKRVGIKSAHAIGNKEF